MLFNSYIFIFLFLPLALLGYYGFNRLGRFKLAQGFLTLMSLWFYGYFNPSYLPIICLSILGNFFLSRLIERQSLPKRLRKLLLTAGVLCNVGVIFYYKYFDFFLSTMNSLFSAGFTLRHIVLPLGISFFTFQQISYLVDSYRGETAGYDFVEYALFVSFFPQLIAGPIVLHREMIPQFRDPEKKRADWGQFGHGLLVFSMGLGKKVLLADVLGRAVSYGFSGLDTLYRLSALDLILISFCYTFQLYFDFSGYCDMATGICHMFHMELPQNFNSPYKAVSFTDFWRRWHMSLGRFLQTYVYFPLGGSRKGTFRTYLNTMIVFILTGIWHGASWNIILWGALEGVCSCISRATNRFWKKSLNWLRRILTFLTHNALSMLFRASSVEFALRYLIRVIRMDELTLDSELLGCFDIAEFSFLEEFVPAFRSLASAAPWLHMGLFLLISLGITMFGKNSSELKRELSLRHGAATVALLVCSILSLSGVHIFLYFNF